MAPGRHAAPAVDGTEEHPADALRVERGKPTDAELAAVTAVLAAAVAEVRAEGLSEPEAAPSEWSRSQRDIQGPLRPGPGRWRSFSVASRF